jgi:hypothetical protein
MADVKTASPEAAVVQSFQDQAADYLERYDPRTTAGHSFSVRKERVLELLRDVPAGVALPSWSSASTTTTAWTSRRR